MLCPRPATAQQGGAWDFSHDIFHLEEAKSNGVDVTPSYPDGPIGDYATGAGAPVRVDGDLTSASGSASFKGQDHIIAYWTPPYGVVPIPKPPATVTVQIDSWVRTFWNSDGYHSEKVQSFSPLLNNGFDDPVFHYDNQWNSRGLHLKTFSTSAAAYDAATGKYRLELPLDIDLSSSMTASGTGYNPSDADGPYTVGDVSAYVQAVTAKGDTRSVVLSRAGAIGETSGLENGEWVTYGDTLFSSFVLFGTIPVPNNQGVTATPVGAWSSDAQAVWSPTGAGVLGNSDSTTFSVQTMPWSGAQRIVNYTIADNDGAKAKAKYVLRLHDPYEILTHNPVTQLAVNPKNLTPVYDGGLLGLTGTYTQSVTYDVHLQSSFSGETEKYLGAKLGLNLEGSWDKTWTESTTININVPAGKLGWLEQRDLYNVHTGTANSWSDKGFTGLVSYTLTEIPADENSRIAVGWVYENVPPPTPIGGGGGG